MQSLFQRTRIPVLCVLFHNNVMLYDEFPFMWPLIRIPDEMKSFTLVSFFKLAGTWPLIPGGNVKIIHRGYPCKMFLNSSTQTSTSNKL